MTVTQEFLRDPYEFAQTKVVLPQLSVQEPGNLKAKAVRPDLTFYQVKGENRVLYGNVSRNVSGANRYDVDFDSAKLSGDWFAVYWLPWKPDQTYRITLKPSSKALVGADIFFTAVLTGCTVYVDGDPSEPTVYHSNAQNLPVAIPEQHKSGAEMYKMLAKTKHMEEQISDSQKALPKSPSHYLPRSVDMFRYMPDALKPSLIEDLKKDTEAKFGADKGSVAPVLGGTVFGKRGSHGVWYFYYQSWTRFYYQKNGSLLQTWIVNRCERFWPGSDIQKPIPIVVI